MKRVYFFIAALTLVNAQFYFNQLSLSERPDVYHPMSKIHLNDEQRKEILFPDENGLEVYQYKNRNNLWSVAIGKLPRFAQDAVRIGTLFKEPKDNEVSTPAYLCRFANANGESESLDLDASCSGKGIASSHEPVGYLSAKTRSGYLTLIRCQNSESGVYLTYNPHCESRFDHVHGLLGTILVSQ